MRSKNSLTSQFKQLFLPIQLEMEVQYSCSSLRVFLYSLTCRELKTCTTHSCQTLSHPVAIPYGATVIRVNSRRGPNFYNFEITDHQNNNSTFSSNTKESTMYLPMLYWKKSSVHINMVAPRLRCFATNRKVAGSIPAGVSGIFQWHKILPIALWPWGRLSL